MGTISLIKPIKEIQSKKPVLFKKIKFKNNIEKSFIVTSKKTYRMMCIKIEKTIPIDFALNEMFNVIKFNGVFKISKDYSLKIIYSNPELDGKDDISIIFKF